MAPPDVVSGNHTDSADTSRQLYLLILSDLIVTLHHKTRHKSQIFKLELFKRSESRYYDLSNDVKLVSLRLTQVIAISFSEVLGNF